MIQTLGFDRPEVGAPCASSAPAESLQLRWRSSASHPPESGTALGLGGKAVYSLRAVGNRGVPTYRTLASASNPAQPPQLFSNRV